ncbi:MAG: calcium-binding protein [Marinibacterium sp.]
MTTYTYSAIGVSYSDDPILDISTTTALDPMVDIVVTAADNSGFSYVYTDPVEGFVSADFTNVFSVTINGADLFTTADETAIFQVNWNDGTGPKSTTLIEIEDQAGTDFNGNFIGTYFYVVMGGDPIPPLTQPGDFDAFNQLVTGISAATGIFAPNTQIDWASIPVASKTEHDVIFGTAANDNIHAGKGNDMVYSSQGADILNGGAGKKDVVTYEDDPAGILAKLAKSTVTDGWGNTDTVKGFERLIGSDFDDAITGNKKPNDIQGGKGNDTIKGGDGNDKLSGGNGNDTISGGDGRDTIKGGKGRDTLKGDNGNDKIDGGKGKDIINAGKGNDTITGGADADTIIFGKNFGTDRLTDFDANWNAEKIDLSDVRSIKTWNDLKKNHLSESGPDVIIDDLNGNTITLENVLLADLNARDFIF